VVWLDLHAVSNLLDRYCTDPGEDLRQIAVVFRIEVLNEYECQTGSYRQMPKQKLKCFSPPADAPIPTTGIVMNSS
jgi:hypothetical protein